MGDDVAGYERCRRHDCARPSEAVVVVVVVDLIAGNGDMEDTMHLPLCRVHADQLLAQVRLEV